MLGIYNVRLTASLQWLSISMDTTGPEACSYPRRVPKSVVAPVECSAYRQSAVMRVDRLLERRNQIERTKTFLEVTILLSQP